MASVEYKITKDFGDKVLRDVFVRRLDALASDNFDIASEMQSAVKEAKVVCVYVSNLSQSLVEMIATATGSVYVIVPKIDETRLYSLKERAIIREYEGVKGNFIICDKNAVYFFDTQLRGVSVKRQASVDSLYDYFIWNFWNNTNREYITNVSDVLEKTFDVCPPLDSKDEAFCYSKSADEVSPCLKKINEANKVAVCNATMNSAQEMIATKKVYEKDKSFSIQNRHFVLVDDVPLQMIETGGKWFVTNYTKDESDMDNSGKFFTVEIENAPLFANVHDYNHEYTYRDSVDKNILDSTFKTVEVAARESEERTISCDKKQFRIYKRMKDSEREASFETYRNGNLLVSDKLAALVDFNVTVNVLKLSKGAVLAEVYGEYKKAESALQDFIIQKERETKKIEERIQDTSKALEKAKQEENAIEQKITDIEAKIADTVRVITSTQEELKKCEEEEQKCNKDREKGEEVGKKKGGLEKQLERAKNDNGKLLKERESYRSQQEQTKTNVEHEKEEKDKSERLLEEKTKTLENARGIKMPFKTVNECKNVIDILGAAGFKANIPRYDLPRYGELYKSKGGYEYVVQDDNLDEALGEMGNNGIADVKIVEQC